MILGDIGTRIVPPENIEQCYGLNLKIKIYSMYGNQNR